MTPPTAPVPEQPPEQRRYAALLDWGTRIGLAVLVLSFAAYVSGTLDAHVHPQRLPELWGLSLTHYLERTASPTGWSWLGLLHLGDMAGVLGIALLASCSVPCLLALVPAYLARRDKAFALICVAEVAVIALAASGWLTGGH